MPDEVPAVYVLVDVEWFQEENAIKHITQIAASRVSEDWNVMAEFSRLVCPENIRGCDWEHMAYRGYSPDEFINGDCEAECMNRFAEFLKEDDLVCVWSGATKKILSGKYELCTGKPLPNRCVCVNNQIYDIIKNRGIKLFEMYAVAEAVGIETPAPKHCSENDVFVLISLMSTLNVDPKKNAEIPPGNTAKKVIGKRERNAAILEKVQYQYVFTPNSVVFHRPTCKHMLRVNEIRGSVSYETAARNRRPCKICKPERIEKINVPQVKDQLPEHASGSQGPQRMIVEAKLLGNHRILISKGKLVGYCHNLIHPGKLTLKIMKEHDCLGKQCRFFEKYEDSGYWIAQEQKCREKEKRKEAKQRQKEEAQRLEDELEERKALFQSYADAFGYNLLIVRLQKESKHHYKIFYVSENSFADGNRFPNFVGTIKRYFPRCRVELRHIRDVDGHFVTVDEYMMRKGSQKGT